MPQLIFPYGHEQLTLLLDDSCFETDQFWPKSPTALANPKKSFLSSVQNPLSSKPLATLVKSRPLESVAIVISDHTRPVPDQLLIPWIVEELGVSDEKVKIIIGTGTHRGSTDKELKNKYGDSLLSRFKFINHDCRDQNQLVNVGSTPCGGKVILNKHYVEADLKLATGFIEPHFFAGFSGGTKAIVPGIAAFETIQHFHRSSLIANPMCTWGELKNNPLQALTRKMTRCCPPDFIVNVTLNLDKAITGIFSGASEAVHDEGSAQALRESMVTVDRSYPVVLTSNSGAPLDQNFYQTVKGLCAASRIVEPGGHVVAISSCAQGLPAEGHFSQLLSRPENNETLADWILNNTQTLPDQWQVQSLLNCLQKSHIHLFSELSDQDQMLTRTQAVASLSETLKQISDQYSKPIPMAVLPMGPLTIPYCF